MNLRADVIRNRIEGSPSVDTELVSDVRFTRRSVPEYGTTAIRRGL
jgi:hypothetical protein